MSAKKAAAVAATKTINAGASGSKTPLDRITRVKRMTMSIIANPSPLPNEDAAEWLQALTAAAEAVASAAGKTAAILLDNAKAEKEQTNTRVQELETKLEDLTVQLEAVLAKDGEKGEEEDADEEEVEPQTGGKEGKGKGKGKGRKRNRDDSPETTESF